MQTVLWRFLNQILGHELIPLIGRWEVHLRRLIEEKDRRNFAVLGTGRKLVVQRKEKGQVGINPVSTTTHRAKKDLFMQFFLMP
ncbi:hypothetical protein D3C87_1750140 [compost metagenome]